MRKGSKASPETRLKQSLSKKGKPSPKRGQKMSLEQRQKLSESLKRYYASKIPDYEYIVSGKRKDRKRIRRERLRKAGGSHTVGEWLDLKAKYNWTCPSCIRKEPEIELTRDHIVAISLGGSDNIENIQPLCRSCNSKKSTVAIRY